MGNVGRTWYVKISQGMVQAHHELGTHQLDHGTQVWDSFVSNSLPENPTERDVLDELYYALSAFMERRA